MGMMLDLMVLLSERFLCLGTLLEFNARFNCGFSKEGGEGLG